MNEKITGYVLLASGILILAFSALSVIAVFTKRAEPVKVFNTQGITLDLRSLLPQQSEIRTDSSLARQEIVSADFLNESSNLAAHIFFMGFLASIGYKISSLGATLLRPMIIKLKTKDGSEHQTGNF